MYLSYNIKSSSTIVGRAGMLYRDLIPDRLGGAIVASHIRIPEGGPVGDSVHFHQGRASMHEVDKLY